MKTIPLTQGQFAIVDNEDFEHLNQYKWYAFRRSEAYSYYAIRNVGRKPNRHSERMHNRIMNAPDGMEIDHRNHNSLDNRRCNLRICTRSQNMGNTRGCKHHSSKFKGVSWNKENKNWRAIIGFNYKQINIGSFAIEADAAKAYDRKAKELFGEFANLNFK